MISYNMGSIESIKEEDENIQWLRVKIDGKSYNAVNYIDLIGRVDINDQVVLNTTAVELALGTGGEHFVMANITAKNRELNSNDHIMKLKYTPVQTQVLSVEAQESEYHDEIKNFKSLDNSIFIIGTLHSNLMPIASYIKKNRPETRINYIMTDGGALISSFSKNIKELKEKNIIDNVITAGNATGGDYEAINIYTAIIFSKEVLKSDISIIAMGPGIVGTGTQYGFSGVEQGYISDGVISLGGRSILVPRISFSDKRKRHNGLSHHSISIFRDLATKSADIVFPILNSSQDEYIKNQIEENGISKRHNIVFEKADDLRDTIGYYNINPRTMGRGYEDDRAFFDTLASVAKYSIKLLDRL
ncbi:MAG: DUF3866 family protein [Andreesenia angusta]|nr:DUF3866 family protein [Andreesenia angusta]